MNRLFLTISVRFLFILSIFWQFPNALFAQTNPENPFEYKIVKSISLPGDEKWDYLAVNERYNRLFIAHTSQVQVVDLKKDSLIATIPNLQGVHGIAFAEDLDLGFTSNGKSSTVTVFDLKTLQVLQEIDLKPKGGKKPDAILYDLFSHQIFVFCGESNNAMVINAKKKKVVAVLALDGVPEYAVSNGKGKVYVNIEDKHAMNIINSATNKRDNVWPIYPAETCGALGIDIQNNRLFVACPGDQDVIHLVNANNGNILQSYPIGRGSDAIVVDNSSQQHLIYCSNSEGTVTIIKQEDADDADHFKVIQTLKTQEGSKTMAFHSKTHTMYIAAGQTDPSDPKKLKSGSFRILIAKRKN